MIKKLIKQVVYIYIYILEEIRKEHVIIRLYSFKGNDYFIHESINKFMSYNTLYYYIILHRIYKKRNIQIILISEIFKKSKNECSF